MDMQEELIRGVAEAAGIDIALAPDGSCDFVVDEAVITARYREGARDWLLVTTVVDTGDAELPSGVAAAVLRQSLFGAGTLGFMPGLFANAVILSGTVAEDGLTVADFMTRCSLLARARAKLAAHLEGQPEADAGQDIGADGAAAFGRVLV